MKIPFKNVMLSEIRLIAPDIDIQKSSDDILEPLLWKLGIDIDFGFEQLTNLFRDSKLPSKINPQVYWKGLERSDKNWRESGNASEELLDQFRSRISASIKQRDIGEYIRGK